MKLIEKLKETTTLKQRIILACIAVGYVAGAVLTIYVTVNS